MWKKLSWNEHIIVVNESDYSFYAPQLVPAGTAEARISYGDSVCLSVTSRCRTKRRWDRDSGSSPYGSLEYLVSYELIWCQWVKRVPSNEGIKEGYPLRNRYFTTIGSCSVKTVADRHRLAAYHNKHCRWAFQWYQHRWPWTTLSPKIGVLVNFRAAKDITFLITRRRQCAMAYFSWVWYL